MSRFAKIPQRRLRRQWLLVENTEPRARDFLVAQRVNERSFIDDGPAFPINSDISIGLPASQAVGIAVGIHDAVLNWSDLRR
jgi:hypothetical protein